ncbi:MULTISPECIES: type VI secretion system lipoprotein TssJ [Gynuella]|uniref:Type VI secretion system lipoprotein TssJ n=1 Tax=Gynuella sunshinyii YC6258 TaxID=1445510 RepID=A0A0C5VGV0_9GAMM|nr:type VI secretion system lipoprotein TssJ [Gynuella sunshinyii]AJQ93817.1 hypothetical protein YC6258_01773 [Gynuella sunshinyii YC6258]
MLKQLFQTTILVLISIVLFSSCATSNLKFQVESSETLNPDVQGNNYAVIVRVYQLTDPRLFDRAPYDELWKTGPDMLADTLISVHEFTVQPGFEGVLNIDKKRGAEYVGVMAFFRSREGSWKVYQKVKSGVFSKSAKLKLNVTGSNINMQYR